MDTREPTTPAAAGTPQPLDPPMVPFALSGTAAWAVAGVVLLLADAPTGWVRTCLAGFLLGLPMLAIMAGHDRRRHRSRGQSPFAGGTGSTSVSS